MPRWLTQAMACEDLSAQETRHAEGKFWAGNQTRDRRSASPEMLNGFLAHVRHTDSVTVNAQTLLEK